MLFCGCSYREKKIVKTYPSLPFSRPQLFIYLFAPLCHLIKEPDLHAGRLESGISLWQGLWEYRHPDSPVFKALVKPKARPLWDQALHSSAHDAAQAGNVFLGSESMSASGRERGRHAARGFPS